VSAGGVSEDLSLGDQPTEELIVVPGEPAPEPAPQKIETPRARELLKLFRIRNYRLLFTGFLTSVLGSLVQVIAQGWLVYSLTKSPFLLGVVTFASSAPMFFVTPFGGTIADRMDRRKLMLITQSLFCLQSAVLTIMTLTGSISITGIIVLGAFQGFVNAFDIPTRQSLLLELVGPQNIRPAIAMNSLAVHISRLLGPPLGGFLVALVGEGWCFAINTFSYTAIFASILMMNVVPRVIHKAAHPLHDLKEGILYAWRNRDIRDALIIISISGGFGGPYIAMMPAIARDLLNLDSKGMGTLMSAIGVGALIGGYALARLGNRDLSRLNVIACAALGIALMAFAQSRHLVLSMLLLVPTSCALLFGGGCTQTVIQSLVGENMRGRMIALYATFYAGSNTWGVLAIGWLGSKIGVGPALTLGGAVCFALACLMYGLRFGWRARLA
jgi:MFS family permease